MSLRGDGLLALSSNDAVTEGAHIILNNAGVNDVTEANSWSIDNYNTVPTPNTLRFFYNANSVSAITIPGHVDGQARVGVNIPTGFAPVSTLQVGGDIAADSGYRTKAGLIGAIGGNLFNLEWTGAQTNLWIDATNLGSINITSDRRLKEDVQLMGQPAVDRVMALRPVSFKYRNTGEPLFSGSQVIQEGFIADELQEVIPSAVNGEKDALTTEGTIQPQTLNMAPIVSVLTKAVQEQQVLIEQLLKKLDEQGAAFGNLRTEHEILKAEVDRIDGHLSNKASAK